MKNVLQYKELTGGVKDVDTKGRRVTGYLSATGRVDSHNDIVQKGAFTKSINENRENIFFLLQHNWGQPLSKFAVLKEDDYGLYFESEPIVKTSYGEDAIKLYEAGILKEHSIGFVSLKDDYNEEDKTRTIKEVKLYEGSAVTIAANRAAGFTGFKSKTKQSIDQEIKTIVRYIRNGNVTDDTFLLLEYSLKELQRQSYELGKATLKESKPDNTYEYTQPSINTINKFINKF